MTEQTTELPKLGIAGAYLLLFTLVFWPVFRIGFSFHAREVCDPGKNLSSNPEAGMRGFSGNRWARKGGCLGGKWASELESAHARNPAIP
jgi:hypothetical protein